jgi:hypothetical protein
MAFSDYSILNSHHRAGIHAMLPAVGPWLREFPAGSNDMFKEFTDSDLKKLKSGPQLVDSRILGANNSDSLVKYLNEVADSEIPGWVSAVVGIGVPIAWMGIVFKSLVKLLNGLGADKRLKASNLAGRISPNSKLSAVQFVTSDVINPKFGFSYILSANLDGTDYHYGLHTVIADIRVTG